MPRTGWPPPCAAPNAANATGGVDELDSGVRPRSADTRASSEPIPARDVGRDLCAERLNSDAPVRTTTVSHAPSYRCAAASACPNGGASHGYVS
jgi:hypothetical protein